MLKILKQAALAGVCTTALGLNVNLQFDDIGTLKVDVSMSDAVAQVCLPPACIAPPPPGGGAAKTADPAKPAGRHHGSGSAVAWYVIASNGCFTVLTAAQAIALGNQVKALRREVTPAEAAANLAMCGNPGAIFYAGLIGKDNKCSIQNATYAYRVNNTPLAQEQRLWSRDGTDGAYQARQRYIMDKYNVCYSQKVTVTSGKKFKKNKKKKLAPLTS